MNKLGLRALKIATLVLLVTGGLVFAGSHNVFAQTEISTTTIPENTATSSPSAAEPVSPAAVSATTPGGDGISKCGDWSLGGSAVCIINFATFTVLGIANFLLGIAGSLLNWVVIKTVFQFGSLIGNSPGLLIAWGIFRDLGNMLLLFGFIFMGLATILDMGTFSAKKALPPLIIFAILMNFSLFAAEAIIDTSNALTSALYSQANTDECYNGTTANASVAGNVTEDCGLNYGIAGHIMQSTGLSSMFNRPPTSVGNEAVISIGLTLFSTIGAVVLLATSIMLIMRVVTLSFLMVAAPIGFAGMAIPPLQGLADRWWKTLISQSFFAPVLFLLIFVSLKITDSFSGTAADRGLAAAISNPSSSVLGIVMIFVIVIGFLIASLVAAKSMGSMGAGFAVSLATRTIYGGVTRGTNLAVGGSATALRYAQQRYAPNSKVGAAINKRVLTPLAGANLDLRRIPGVGGALGKAGAGDAAKPADHATFADIKHQYDDFRNDKSGKQRTKEYDARVAAQRLEKEAHDGILTKESKDILTKMSEKQLTELHGIKDGIAVLAQNLTPEQFDKLMNSTELDGGVKSKLRDNRFRALKATITDAAANPNDVTKQNLAKNAVNALTNKDLGHLMQSGANIDLISNDKFTSLLSEDQFKEARKNTNLTPIQQSDFDTSRNKINGPIAVAARINSLNAEAINKIPGSTLSNSVVLNAMSGRQFAAVDPDKLSPAELGVVATHINTQRSIGSQQWSDFDTLRTASPKVRQRWAGIVP